MKSKIFILVTILLISRISFAEDLVTEKLRNEPASMYDLGVLRLYLYLNRDWVGNTDITYADVSSFNFRKIPGKLFIKLYFDVGFFENSQKKCKKIINTFRRNEFIMKSDYTSTISLFFTHTEYIRSGYDLDKNNVSYHREFLKQINNMFTIIAMNFKSETICWGKYNGKDFNISEW